MPVIRASARKYKKESMFLGIIERGNKFYTGQEESEERPNGLTQAEIKKPEIIPVEKRNQFPMVVTPDTYLTVHDGQTIQREGESKDDDILWGLIKLQPNIALSKSAHNPNYHDWYIEDPEIEAKVKAKQSRSRNRALFMVDQASISMQQTFLIYVSNEYGQINVNPRILSSDRVYNEATEAAERHPEAAVTFFEGKDPVMKKKVGILELITYEIIRKKNNAYYDGQTYLGASLSEVSDYLDNSSNAPTRDKLFKLLNHAKNGGKDYTKSQKEVDSIKALEIINKAKILYADEKFEKANNILNQVKSLDLSDEAIKEFEKIHKKTLSAMVSLNEENQSESNSMDNYNDLNVSKENVIEDNELRNMTEKELMSLLRSRKISGWNKSMNKQELIAHYKNNL